jgi:hypothetical protein
MERTLSITGSTGSGNIIGDVVGRFEKSGPRWPP